MGLGDDEPVASDEEIAIIRRIRAFENLYENHEEDLCDPATCPLCRLERKEITQAEFDQIFDDY